MTGGYFRLATVFALLFTSSVSAAPFQRRSPLTREYPKSSSVYRDTQELQRRRSAFSAERFEALTPPPITPPQKTPALRSIRERLEMTSRRRVFKYQEINNRLDRLEGVLQRRTRYRDVPVIPLAPAPAIIPDQAPAARTQRVPLPAVDPDLRQIPPAESSPEKPQAQPAPVPEIITENAVDRVALADSLFGSDQFEIALKLYLELAATEQDPALRMWIHYQVAACSRRLHKYDQARKYYRIVAGNKSDSLYPKLARWWLDVIQRRITYQSQQQDLRAQLNLPGKADGQPAK